MKFFLLFAAFAVAYTSVYGQNVDVDIIFVLDGSGSIKDHNFILVKDWVKQVVSKLDLSTVHIGVIQYSSFMRIVTEIPLGEQDSYQSFNDAVQAMEYQGGYTFTARAIQKTMEDFEQYGREDACKMAVILTDGRSTDSNNLPIAANALRNAGVKSIAVGVAEAKFSELTEIATGEANNTKGVRMLNDFNSISSVAQTLSNSISKCEQALAGMADVMFVLDGSGSIGDDFIHVKKWVKALTRSLNIDDGSVNVGVIQYSHWYYGVPMAEQLNMVTEVALGTQESYDLFSTKVDDIVRIGKGTSTGHALEKLLYDFGLYGREGVCKFAVILTDGRANDPEHITTNVVALEEQHVIRLVVGVGKTRQYELEEIASETATAGGERGEKAIITLDRYDEILDTISFFTSNLLCGGNHIVGEYHQ